MKFIVYLPQKDQKLCMPVPTSLILNKFAFEKMLNFGNLGFSSPKLNKDQIRAIKILIKDLKSKNGGTFNLVTVEDKDGTIVKIDL